MIDLRRTGVADRAGEGAEPKGVVDNRRIAGGTRSGLIGDRIDEPFGPRIGNVEKSTGLGDVARGEIEYGLNVREASSRAAESLVLVMADWRLAATTDSSSKPNRFHSATPRKRCSS